MSDWTGSIAVIGTSTSYATAAEFKSWLGITDAIDDTLIAAVLAIVGLNLPLLAVLGVLAPLSIAWGWFSVRKEFEK